MQSEKSQAIKISLDLIDQNKYNEAITKLNDYLNINPKELEILNLLALIYEKNNNLEESIIIYKKILFIEKSFKIYDRLGEVYIKKDQYEQSKKYFNKSLLINEKNPTTQNNLGMVLAYLDEEKKSITHFKKAISLDRNYRDPVYNLLEIYEKSNSIINFKKLIDSVLKIFKNDQIIKFYYSLLLKKNNEYKKAKQNLLEINMNNNIWNIKKHYQLGVINDKLKNYSEAYQYFENANIMTLKLIGKHRLTNNSFMKKLDEYLIQSKIKFKTPASINKKVNHFFLIGFPRSGTTLLDTILRRHKNIIVCEEKNMVSEMNKDLVSIKNLQNISNKKLQNLADKYFSELSKVIDIKKINKNIIVDKLPLNIVEARIINLVFPNAKFIFSLRHPLDCVLSSYIQQFKLNNAMINFLDLETTAEMYDKIMKIWKNYKEISTDNIHQIKYEDLINNQQSTLLKLMNFMGLKWDKKLLDSGAINKERGRIRTPSYDQVIQPIYKSSVYRWKNYTNELSKITLKIDKWCKYFDYKIN